MRVKGSDIGNLQIRGTEIITPLRNAMCLIDRDERHIHVAQLGLEELGRESLRRYIKQLYASKDTILKDTQYLFVLLSAIDSLCPNTQLMEVVNLVFHQGNEGSDYNANALHGQCWHLKGNGLTTTRRH